ncbi:MAG: alpha/beta hydrolase [Betaproteobacteria bacterium]|nr:alpha/beta hydrolase [Betaproteobacteria bacterium]
MKRHRHSSISIQSDQVWLDGFLSDNPDARAFIVCFATTHIASRTAREFLTAQRLHEAGYATLLIDGLTRYEEKRDPDVRYDIPRLTRRLLAILDWVRHQPNLENAQIGLHTSGTAAAAAVKAALRSEPPPFAIVSRAGRLDLAGAAPLRQNRVPIRVIAGDSNDATRGPSEQAYPLIGGRKSWVEIPGAGELFLEPGALEAAARATVEWFNEFIALEPPADKNDTVA